MKLGSPLQRIGLGMVIVVLVAQVPAAGLPAEYGYDLLPNRVGWLLVVHGAVALARHDRAFSTARWLAVLAGVVSVPAWFPQLVHRLDDSGQWAASLPQIAFCLALCHAIGTTGARQEPRDAYAAQRFGLLVWGFGALAVLPVLTLGGGLKRLAATTQVASMVVNLAFVYVLFRVHRREWLGGPGPLEIHPRSASSGKRET